MTKKRAPFSIDPKKLKILPHDAPAAPQPRSFGASGAHFSGTGCFGHINQPDYDAPRKRRR